MNFNMHQKNAFQILIFLSSLPYQNEVRPILPSNQTTNSILNQIFQSFHWFYIILRDMWEEWNNPICLVVEGEGKWWQYSSILSRSFLRVGSWSQSYFISAFLWAWVSINNLVQSKCTAVLPMAHHSSGRKSSPWQLKSHQKTFITYMCTRLRNSWWQREEQKAELRSRQYLCVLSSQGRAWCEDLESVFTPGVGGHAGLSPNFCLNKAWYSAPKLITFLLKQESDLYHMDITNTAIKAEANWSWECCWVGAHCCLVVGALCSLGPSWAATHTATLILQQSSTSMAQATSTAPGLAGYTAQSRPASRHFSGN